MLKNHIQTRVPTAYPGQTVGEVLRRLRGKRFTTADHVFVLNNPRQRQLAGVASVRALFAARDEQKIGAIAREDFPSIAPTVWERTAAILALRKNFDVVAVVEPQTGRFLGAIDSPDLLRILHDTHTDQLLSRAGVLRGGVVDIVKARATTLVRLRAPWLLVGLVGGMLAASLVSFFEGLLEQVIALVFFIPVVAYMNGAVGAQTVTLFVRALSLEKVVLYRYLLKEFAVGVMMGVIFGGLIFAFAYFAFGLPRVAQAVGLSMVLGIPLATLNAIWIPYLFHHLHKDPAFASDSLVTIIQDLISILIYLLVASVLVLR